MQIGDVSKKLGLPASTIRYYERVGLIERPLRVAGRRQFDERALSALRFVRLAQHAGFTIAEIKSLLRVYSGNPNPRRMWRSLADTKRTQVRQQIADLRRRDRVLGALIDCECPTLGECAASGRDSWSKTRVGRSKP